MFLLLKQTNVYSPRIARYMVHCIVNKNSSGDEIANVNFLYDDTLHALQNIVRC